MVHNNRAVRTVIIIAPIDVGFELAKVGQHFVEAPLVVTQIGLGIEVIGDAPVEGRPPSDMHPCATFNVRPDPAGFGTNLC
jgi:hypothetical protein